MKTFRGLVDGRGSKWIGPYPPHPNAPEWARPAHLLDLETNSHRIVLRLIWRWRPFYLALVPFFRPYAGTVVLRLGRRLRG